MDAQKDKKILVTPDAAKSVWHCLANMDPNGRPEIRLHKKCRRAVKDACIIEISQGIDRNTGEPKKTDEWRKTDQWIVLPQECADYLKRICEEAMKEGFEVLVNGKYETVRLPGSISDGYDDIVEAIETAEDVVNEVQKEKSEKVA